LIDSLTQYNTFDVHFYYSDINNFRCGL